MYLDSIIPAQLFVRGSNLDTPTPTYYGVTLTRGLEAKLVRVVNGVETPLASIKSSAYFSSQWLRVHLTAEGDRLRVTLYRSDVQQWLTPDGVWADSPDFALEVRDGTITGGGNAGVGRAAKFSGVLTFDDFTAQSASATSGPVVSIAPVTSPVVGEVTFRATVTGTVSRIEFRLNNQLRAVEPASPAEWTFDSTTVPNGSYTLTVRAFDANGDYGSSELVFAVLNPNVTPIPIPNIPRHYDHIRIAQLAYSGNPMGEFEKKLLRESVDVVIPNPRYFPTIEATSPATPQLIYSNVSNLYQGLLTDWLNFADRTGAKRELAFSHVTRATDFSGNSSSSQPVTWFWGTHQTSPTGTVTDVTSAARGGRNFNVTFGGAGQSTSVSYPDKFRELTVSLVTGGASGWGGVWEYVSAVDASSKPTAWKTLTLVNDGTTGLTHSGTITFDPPADWKTSIPGAGTERLFSVRFRVTSGTAAQGAELKTLFGRDYVRAFGGTAGVIPAFDTTADRDGDGYLNDTEFAGRRAGFDARFYYESRLFYPYYGQMRFVTNPSSSALRGWAAEYHDRLLSQNPLADGIFMDNAHGKLPFAGVSVVEPTTTYSTDSGALTAAVSRKIAPQWVMANTAGGTSEGDGVAAGAASVIEEFLLRPMQANWSEVGDAVNLVARRLAASSSPAAGPGTTRGSTTSRGCSTRTTGRCGSSRTRRRPRCGGGRRS
ncbi:MAG TPA: Ig-like domain-containing protein, partial [Gemmataceae bacterium]|nr:Ig-like domain-containing protein [Gemmataceae bacterium]